MKLCDQESVQLKASKYDISYVMLTNDRILFLKENLTKDVAAELSALLLYMDNKSVDDISIYFHCNGGDADSLVQIYDVMQMIRSPVQTICLGKAYSAAAVLLAAGNKGKRFAFKNSKIMVHGIQCIFPIVGHDQVNSKNYLEFLNRSNDNIMKILAHHTGHTLSKIKEDCRRDLYLDAKQALKYGIIDNII